MKKVEINIDSVIKILFDNYDNKIRAHNNMDTFYSEEYYEGACEVLLDLLSNILCKEELEKIENHLVVIEAKVKTEVVKNIYDANNYRVHR